MIFRKKAEAQQIRLENCMGGAGTVLTRKLLSGPEEMHGKGRAYVRHELNPGVSIGEHRHAGEMESIFILSGRAVHTINGQVQHLCPGDIAVADSGDIHSIACEGQEPLILTALVLYTG